MTFPLKALAIAGALLATAGAAHAATGTAVTALNVRSGPGTGYPVVDTMPAGETVNIVGCEAGWCEIGMGAQGTGFVSQSYLDLRGGVRERVIVEEEPEIITGLSIGGYWDSRPYYYDDGFYYWRGRWYSERPGRPGWERSWRRDHRPRGGRDWNNGPRRDWDGPRRPDRDRDWSGPRRPDRDGGRPPRGFEPNQRGDGPDGRFQRMERGGDRGDRGGDRGGRGDGPRMDRGDAGQRGPQVSPRGDSGPSRGGGDFGGSRDSGPRDGGGMRGGGGDRGDRVGLDKAR